MTKWVFPDKFVDQFAVCLADAPPLPGEEARYAQGLLPLRGRAKKDPALKAAMTNNCRKEC